MAKIIAGLPSVVLTAEEIAYYADNPVEFVDDNIMSCIRAKGHRDATLTNHQKSVLNAIRDYYRVGIESAHGTGKSAVFALAAIWFLVTRYNTIGNKVKVPIIAPTYHQLYDVIWPEFKTWLPQSRLYPMFEFKNDEMFITGHKDEMFARARSPKEEDNLQGFHAPHLLWICDEAFGIQNERAWAMVEGSCTEPDNRILFGGQHTIIIGYCHDAFHKDKCDWHTLRFSALDSPLAKPEYAKRVARKYGKNSDVYRVRVLGQEPKGNPDAWIQMSVAEAARVREVSPKGAIRMGCDSARFGDDLTVVTTCQGHHVFPQAILPQSDEVEIYNLIVDEARKYRKIAGFNAIIECRIDVTGGYGAGAYDLLLRNTEDGIRPIAINFGGDGDNEYADLVSCMWGNLKDEINELELPDDDFLIEEIGSREYTHDSNGRVKIEPKSKFKDDHDGSPDRSDSLVLCLFTQHWRKRVWEYCTQDVLVQMDIGWRKKGEQKNNLHYGAVILNEDMSVNVLCALWDQRRGRLYLYDGWQSEDPSPVTLVPQLSARMHLRDFVTTKILGNARVFEDKGARPVSRAINEQLRTAGLVEHRIKPARKYDEFGATVAGVQLWKLKRIFVSNRIEAAVDKFQEWVVMKGDTPPPTGYCEALCLIISELKQEKEIDRTIKPEFRDYAKKELVQAVYRQTERTMA